MKARSVASFVWIVAVLPAAPAHAQDHGQVGLSMGYPASVGIVWQVADRFAVRPEISLVQSSTVNLTTLTVTFTTPFNTQTQTTQTQLTIDSTTVGTGVSALFYVGKREGLSTYVSPRYAYTRGTGTTVATSTSTGSGTAAPSTTETATRSHVVTGSFGAQYALSRRFCVFGEIGLGYTHGKASPESSPSSSPSTTSRSESTNHAVSTRSGVGVVFYFR